MYNLRAHILLCYGGACISSNAGSVKEAIEKYKKGELKPTQGPSVNSKFGIPPKK